MAFWPKTFVFGSLLLLLAGVFQNCNRDDEEPTITYHCLPENFTNDCDKYDTIGKSTGYGFTGMRAEAATFISGNSQQILFTERDGDDASVPGKVVLYNWKDQKREVLSTNSPFYYDYDIAENRMVCANSALGPIVYFHLDSFSSTLSEIPQNGGITKEPAWLSDGETIVHMAAFNDLIFQLWSFNRLTGEKIRHDDFAEGIDAGDLLLTSISETDDLLLFRPKNNYYIANFYDLKDITYFISSDETWPLSSKFQLNKDNSRAYHSSPYAIHYAEYQKEWHVRALCLGGEEIHYMDVSDDEKYIVYMFEYPVEFSGGKQILASKLRIIDIENCKEYDINPFE